MYFMVYDNFVDLELDFLIHYLYLLLYYVYDII